VHFFKFKKKKTCLDRDFWVQNGTHKGKRGDMVAQILRLRTSGAILLLPIYSFMLCTGTALPLFLHVNVATSWKILVKIEVNKYVYVYVDDDDDDVYNEVITSNSLFCWQQSVTLRYSFTVQGTCE
jgi:hypothetical protein